MPKKQSDEQMLVIEVLCVFLLWLKYNSLHTKLQVQGGPKTDHFLKFMTLMYDDVGRPSM